MAAKMWNRYSARLNPDTGNPEILHDGHVVAKGSYEGFAYYPTGGTTLVVFGAYWEGSVPPCLIGTLQRLEPCND